MSETTEIQEIFVAIVKHVNDLVEFKLGTIYKGKNTMWVYDESEKRFAMDCINNIIQIRLYEPKKTNANMLTLSVGIDSPNMFPHIDAFLRRVAIEF